MQPRYLLAESEMPSAACDFVQRVDRESGGHLPGTMVETLSAGSVRRPLLWPQAKMVGRAEGGHDRESFLLGLVLSGFLLC